MEDLNKKIDILKNINTDDSNFIAKVLEVYLNNKKNLELKIINSTINSNTSPTLQVIDLDKIYCAPFIYTKMRIKLDGIIDSIKNVESKNITKHFCKKLVLKSFTKELTMLDGQIDIVDFVKSIKPNSNFAFVASKIDEESVFKEEEIKKAIKIINISDNNLKYEAIYDEVYNYLSQDFVSNKYCDFKKNRCVSQRHLTVYSFYPKNGCCFRDIKTCHNLKNSNCLIECLPCRLYSCPYLSKRGITYYASEFVLLKAFLSKEQRHPLVFDFFKPKEKILEKIK